MSWSIQNNVNFTSRKPELRKADKIMRNMMNLYPSQSISKFRFYNVLNNENIDCEKMLTPAIKKIVQIRLNRAEILKKDYLSRTINDIKNYKIANCGELALLAKGAFLANGFKDLKIASIKLKRRQNPDNFKLKDLDHCCLLINGGKDADLNHINSFDKHTIIVDPWMGFVDYIQSALNRYSNKFIKSESKTQKYKLTFSVAEIPESSVDTCEKLKREHPEFIV